VKLRSKYTTNYSDYSTWHIGKKHLCLRAGTKGFVCEGDAWADYGFFGESSDHFGYFKTIDPSLGLCLRVFTSELGRVKIPQLALYPPVAGYPSCAPESTLNFKRGKWPYRYDRYHFVIPMIHVNYGIATAKACNGYSVFFSNAWEKKDPFQNYNELKSLGKYLLFPTGVNDVTAEHLAKYPAPWPVEMEFTDDDAIDVYLVAGTGPQDVMPYDAFCRYLAYWYLYYPVVAKNVRGYPFGASGGTRGPFQGYLKYYSYKDDAYVGTGKVWQKYFGTSESMGLLPNLTLDWGTTSWEYEKIGFGGGRDYQLRYYGISDELFQELAVIRSMIEKFGKRRQFKFFPFSSKPKMLQVGRSKIKELELRKFSFISQAAFAMNKRSELKLIGDRKCPLCQDNLWLPKVLAERTFTEDIMCMSCGYKALSNLHYLAVKNVRPNEDNCMWCPDIDMGAVLNDRVRVQSCVGADSE
jgi:hypothetical protein